MLVYKSSLTQVKPFACDMKGCEMTFTNKDHLDWHRKKHEMMLNLGLVNKTTANEVADQTPTPTRFIRNCEEIGLFQDLQNVNPFDELFKKATEVVKNGDTLEIQTNTDNSDDTLHTPHILPHNIENIIEQPNEHVKHECQCKAVFPCSDCDNVDLHPTVLVIHNNEENINEEIKENIKKGLIKVLNKSKTPAISLVPLQDLTYEKDDESLSGLTENEQVIKENTQSAVNKKLEIIKETKSCTEKTIVKKIFRKRKQKLGRNIGDQLNPLTENKDSTSGSNLKVVVNAKLNVKDMTTIAQKRYRKRIQQRWEDIEQPTHFAENKPTITKKNSHSAINTELEKIREMNRAAQNRCRKKKQQLWRDMEEELSHLKQENYNLRQELEALKFLHSKCQPVANQGAVVTTILPAESSQSTTTNKITSPAPVPLLIQFLPSSQLPLVSPETSTLPPTSMTTVKNIILKKDKSRTLRKILPNI